MIQNLSLQLYGETYGLTYASASNMEPKVTEDPMHKRIRDAVMSTEEQRMQAFIKEIRKR